MDDRRGLRDVGATNVTLMRLEAIPIDLSAFSGVDLTQGRVGRARLSPRATVVSVDEPTATAISFAEPDANLVRRPVGAHRYGDQVWLRGPAASISPPPRQPAHPGDLPAPRHLGLLRNRRANAERWDVLTLAYATMTTDLAYHTGDLA